MPTPQVEDGYTRLANELLDAIIRFPFTKRQYKVMLLLARKTYGYNKKSDDMTVTQISNQTGLTRPHASGTLAELVELGCVLKRDGRHGYVLGINKNYRTWGASQNGTCPETGITPSQNGTVSVPKRDTQKTTPKDNTKRHIWFDRFWDAYPKKVKRKPSMEKWQRKNLDAKAEEIISDVKARKKRDRRWLAGFVPDPTTYLTQERWTDEIEATPNDDDIFAGAK